MIQVSLYSPANAFICRLPEWTNLDYQEELNNPGVGNLVLPRNGMNVSTLLALQDGIIRVEEPGSDTFGFLFDTEDEDLASDDGLVRISGPGELAVLERALVYPQYGVGKDPRFGFADKNPGFIMKTLIDLAKQRGALPSVTYSFTDTVDSADNPWRFTASINFEPVSLLAAVQNLSNNGWADFNMVDGVLHMYNPETTMAKPLLGLWQNVFRSGTTIGSGVVIASTESSTIDFTNPADAGPPPWNSISTLTLNVVDEGVHQFRVTSDDRAQLYLDGQAILPSGALSNTVQTTFTGSSASLDVGPHSVEVHHSVASGSERLYVEYAPPGQAFRVIRASPPVIIRRAREVKSAPRKKQRSTMATNVLVVGAEGANIEVSRPIPGVDRREVLLSDGRLSLNGTMIAFGERHLEASRMPSEGSTVAVDQTACVYAPRRDYRVGDYIYCDHLRTEQRILIPQRVSSIACSWQTDGTVETSLELNDVFLEAGVKNNRRIEGITNGAANENATPVAYEDKTVPKAPTTANVQFTQYTTKDGVSLNFGTVTWDTVTQNTDGSPYVDPDGYALSWATNGNAYRPDMLTGISPAHIDNIKPGDKIVIRLKTKDVNNHYSVPFYSQEFTAPTDSVAPPQPTKPATKPLFQGALVTWDGNGTQDGQTVGMPSDFNRLEVWRSNPDGVGAGPNFVPVTQGILVTTLNGAATVPVTDLVYGKTYYFKFIAYDRLGNASLVSPVSDPLQTIEQPPFVVDTSNLNLSIGGVNYTQNSSFEQVSDTNPLQPAKWQLAPTTPSTTAGWSISSVRKQGVFGSQSMLYDFTNGTGNAIEHWLRDPRGMDADPGQIFIASGYVWLDSLTSAGIGTDAVSMRIEFLDVNGAIISQAVGGSVAFDPSVRGQWQRVQSGKITAPAGTRSARMFGPVVRTLAGQRIRLFADNVQLELSNYMTAYSPAPDDILPGTISKTQILDDSITTPKIVSEAVVANKIAADNVTTRHLVVTNFENLAEDADFALPQVANGLQPASTWVRDTGWSISTTGGRGTPGCATFTGAASGSITNGNSVQVIQAGDTRSADAYILTAFIKSTSDATGTVAVQLVPYDVTGAIITSGIVTGNQVVAGTTWRVSSAQISVPAGAVEVRARITATGVTAGTWSVDDVFWKRMQNADVIIDGAILAKHIETTSFNAMIARIDQAIITSAMIGTVSATSITAGTLSSSVVLGGRITTALTGARAEMNAQGFLVYTTDPVSLRTYEAIKLGTGSKDYLGISGPDGVIKGAIDSTGRATLSGLTVDPASDPEFLGKKLTELLSGYSDGIQAYAWVNNNTNASATTSEIGWFEVSADLRAGRIYRMRTNSIYLISNASSDTTGRAQIKLRMTTDGSTPSTASTQYASAQGSHGDTVAAEFYYSATSDVLVRVLLSVSKEAGAGTTSFRGNATSVNPATLVIEDVGNTPGNRIVYNTGGGTAVESLRQYTRTYLASFDRNFYIPDGGSAFASRADLGSYLRVGDSSAKNRSILGGFRRLTSSGTYTTPFDDITTAGAVNKVELYLYSPYWEANSGIDLWYGTHNLTTNPTSYPSANVTLDRGSSSNWPNPGGRWITLPSALYDGWRTGSIRGFILGGPNMESQANSYGYFASYNSSSYPNNRPQLRITYTA